MKISYNKNDLGKSFGLAVAAMLLVQVLLSAIFGQWIDMQSTHFKSWVFWLVQAIYTLAIGSVALVYSKISKTNFLTATKIKTKPQWAHICWGCLATLFLISLMTPVNEWFLDLIEMTGLKRPSVDMPVQLAPMLIVATLLPAFTEEILFRGTISQSLEPSKNKWGSVATCGALFALFHLNPAQTLHQFVLGCFLTLLVFRSGSIWTSVIVHFFNNFVAVMIIFFMPDQTVFITYGWIFALVGALGFVGCVVGYIFTTNSKWGAGDDEAVAKMDRTSLIILIVAVVACGALWVSSLFI